MVKELERERILGVAQGLFYSRGIQSVGMDEFCRLATVSRRAFYSLFGSKDALVAEVITGWDSNFMSALQGAVAAAETPRDRVLAVFDFLQVFFEMEVFRGCGFINTFGELGSVSPTVAQLARNHKKAFEDLIVELVHDAGGPDYLGPQLAMLANGAMTTAAIFGNSEPALQSRQAAEVLFDSALATSLAR